MSEKLVPETNGVSPDAAQPAEEIVIEGFRVSCCFLHFPEFELG